MTLASSTAKSGPYSCNGATTAFPFSFLITDKADLSVYLTDAEGNDTRLTLDGDYTVSGVASESGGTVATSTA